MKLQMATIPAVLLSSGNNVSFYYNYPPANGKYHSHCSAEQPTLCCHLVAHFGTVNQSATGDTQTERRQPVMNGHQL